MKLKHLATIKINLKAADFWIVRRGSAETVGKVVPEFYREHIGIRVFRTDILLPDYLQVAMMHLYASGVYQPLAKGTLALQHISV